MEVNYLYYIPTIKSMFNYYVKMEENKRQCRIVDPKVMTNLNSQIKFQYWECTDYSPLLSRKEGIVTHKLSQANKAYIISYSMRAGLKMAHTQSETSYCGRMGYESLELGMCHLPWSKIKNLSNTFFSFFNKENVKQLRSIDLIKFPTQFQLCIQRSIPLSHQNREIKI